MLRKIISRLPEYAPSAYFNANVMKALFQPVRVTVAGTKTCKFFSVFIISWAAFVFFMSALMLAHYCPTIAVILLHPQEFFILVKSEILRFWHLYAVTKPFLLYASQIFLRFFAGISILQDLAVSSVCAMAIIMAVSKQGHPAMSGK